MPDYPRPFECSDETFVNSVLDDHFKTPIDHDIMVARFYTTNPPAPLTYVYEEHDEEIPDNCNEWLVEIAFDPTKKNNTDINVHFIQWDQTKPDPVSVSGRIYYSLVVFNGVRNIKQAAKLELRKSIEYTSRGAIVTAVIRALKADDTPVYHGDLTSQIPLHISNI